MVETISRLRRNQHLLKVAGGGIDPGEQGQAGMVVIALLLLVLTVVPAVVVNQVVDQAPIMSRSELALQAEAAARSGIYNFEYYLDDPQYKNNPALVSSLPTQSQCESSTSGGNWETVTVGTTSGEASSSFEYYLVDNHQGKSSKSKGNKNKGSYDKYLFSLGRSGVPGHYVCRELKAAFLESSPTGTSPGQGSASSTSPGTCPPPIPPGPSASSTSPGTCPPPIPPGPSASSTSPGCSHAKSNSAWSKLIVAPTEVGSTSW